MNTNFKLDDPPPPTDSFFSYLMHKRKKERKKERSIHNIMRSSQGRIDVNILHHESTLNPYLKYLWYGPKMSSCLLW
jgi:hypothetical protein